MIRDILNYLGEKIGELDLPDNTPEEVWVEKLSVYAIVPEVQKVLSVSPRQMRSALLLSGFSNQTIVGAISYLSSPQKELAEIAWEYSTSFDRQDATVAAIGIIIGLNSDQLDELWNLASSI